MEEVVLFTRQKRDGSAESEQQTLEAQIRVIEEYAGQLNLRIRDRFVEAGISAHDLLEKVIAYLQHHCEVRAIITYSVDRLIRNPADYSAFVDSLNGRDIRLYLAVEGIMHPVHSPVDSVHPVHQFVTTCYINVRRARILRGMTAKALDGHSPSLAPIGYLNVPLASGRGGIVPDPHSAKLVRQLFEMYATLDYSMKQLAAWAHIVGLVPRRRARPISRAMICSMLRNEFYAGVFTWAGKRYRGAYEPIVSRDLWERVQTILSLRKSSPK
jgi:DNA invertase Pin-like site-specific DNA recombinase